jgi:uncharacterized protein (DUF427 family)
MGMMTGSGPFSRNPEGTWNFDAPPAGQAMYIEPIGKRVRVVLGDQTIADSAHTQLVSEAGHQPIYYFPRSDVRAEVLEPSDRHTRCPKKGEASYHTLRVGDRVEEAAAWYYPEPLRGAEAIRDHIAFYFHRMDHWFEEDTEIFTHPKDIYHRIDVYPSSRHVRISLEGEVLAESTRAMALFESNLPTRWYLPREDVSAKLIESDTVTTCGYKGQANYYSVELPSGEVVKDLVWYYREPFHDGLEVKDLLCFLNERVDLEIDGEAHGRPRTDWTRGVKGEKPMAAAPAPPR